MVRERVMNGSVLDNGFGLPSDIDIRHSDFLCASSPSRTGSSFADLLRGGRCGTFCPGQRPSPRVTGLLKMSPPHDFPFPRRLRRSKALTLICCVASLLTSATTQ